MKVDLDFVLGFKINMAREYKIFQSKELEKIGLVCNNRRFMQGKEV